MDLRHLRHFIALADTGSLHRAARRLNLQQPALSQSIRALEADVGISLVDRSASGTRLTRAGEAFLAEARNILSLLDRAVQIAQRAGIGTEVTLRLGISRDSVTTRLTAVLNGFHNRTYSPPALTDASVSQHRRMLDNGLLDLALLPTALMPQLNHAEHLWTEEVHLVLPTTHPLAAHNTIDFHQLRDISFVVGPSGDDGDGTDHILLNACRVAGLDVTIAIRASFLETRLMLVAAGLGVATLPASSPMLTTAKGIVGRPVSPPLHMTIVAVWPTSGLTPAAQRFLTIARSFKENGLGDTLIEPS